MFFFMFFLTRTKNLGEIYCPFVFGKNPRIGFFFFPPCLGERSITVIFLIMWGATSKKVAAPAQFPVGASASVRICTILELVSLSTGGELHLLFYFVSERVFQIYQWHSENALPITWALLYNFKMFWKNADKIDFRKVGLTMEFKLEEFKPFCSLYHNFINILKRRYVVSSIYGIWNYTVEVQVFIK